ncbi:glycosyltransferase [Streptococcus ruminantium]|uniref:glycosyltransferase n=1 Tax=Streptococcus ruminantium TaxID=1917441 RepID=UPI0013EF5184|nr:glycosyltransferase [Streptococcus ruminantium]
MLIATYNGEAFIKKQLESIKNQTLSPKEVIICDDCSTDKTVEIVQTFIVNNQLSNWKIVHNTENLGHYGTFLKLAILAEGKHIFFSDQDDIWSLEKIELMDAVLRESENSMVFCQSRFIDENDVVTSSQKISGTCYEVDFQEMLTTWPSGYQMAVKKQFLNDVIVNRYHELPGFDYHDVLFGMLSPVYGKVVKLDRVLDSHRIHHNNATISSTTRSFSNSKKSRVTYLKKVRERYKSVQTILLDRNQEFFKQIIDRNIDFIEIRIKFLQKRKLRDLVFLLQNQHLYGRKKDLISDVLYGYALNGIIKWFINFRK